MSSLTACKSCSDAGVINIKKYGRDFLQNFMGRTELLFPEEKYSEMVYLDDDRGLDIVSEKRETIYPLYKNYNEWILDYDREHINKLFRNN